MAYSITCTLRLSLTWYFSSQKISWHHHLQTYLIHRCCLNRIALNWLLRYDWFKRVKEKALDFASGIVWVCRGNDFHYGKRDGSSCIGFWLSTSMWPRWCRVFAERVCFEAKFLLLLLFLVIVKSSIFLLAHFPLHIWDILLLYMTLLKPHMIQSAWIHFKSQKQIR